ncbi:MAG: hypothetical protein R3C53_07950 [Pirellulaceae bacterium]
MRDYSTIICTYLKISIATLLGWAGTIGESAAGEIVRLPVTQDNSIVMVDGEWEVNAGQQGRIRIKGNQHIVAMAFDTRAIQGHTVKQATLVCVKGEQEIQGISVSTIASPWNEERSNGLTAGVVGQKDWGYSGARFPAVSGGNGFTLVYQAKSVIRDGNYYWNVPPDFVHAMAIGVAHGLALHEFSAETRRNPTIFAREQSGRKPYLEVELDDRPEAEPLAASALQLTPQGTSSAELQLRSPKAGFAYEVTLDGTLLGRHNIPMVDNGQLQTIALRDFPAEIATDQPYEIEVVTLNRIGERSPPAKLRGIAFQSAPVDRPVVSFAPAQTSPVPGISVIPVTDKYDLLGEAVGDLPDDYRTHNAVFDGQQVNLTAAAGEVVGFQLLLRQATSQAVSVDIRLDQPGPRIEMHRAIYVPVDGRSVPDPLLPLSDSLALHADQDTCVVADIYIPFDAATGIRTGKISISDGRVLPLRIKVLPISLPREATFFCEMNGYGLPDHVDEYYALQRIAYDHRVHANILHYSHHTAAPGSRKSNMDMRLRSGRRMDNQRYDAIAPNARDAYWDDFVEAFGPYIDGSLFQDGHRGPIAAPGFYLTFHESWPLNCRSYFDGNPDAYQAFVKQPAYAQTYVNILQDFARLAEDKRWHQTGFQVYFNNKGSLAEESKAPWILDEPASYWDYRALQYYGELTDRGHSDSTNVNIDFRIDISRPEYCRGQLSHRDGLWVVSAAAFQNYRRLVTDRLHDDDLNVWVYGTSNRVQESNRNLPAWALDAWQHGATGIVPWQTINKSGSALKEADQLGLFIFDKTDTGDTVIRHSLRLKAYREAQQLIELLNLLQQRRNWSREQMRLFVNQYVDLGSRVDQANDADAGTTVYSRLSATGFETLKAAVTQLLEASSKP